MSMEQENSLPTDPQGSRPFNRANPMFSEESGNLNDSIGSVNQSFRLGGQVVVSEPDDAGSSAMNPLDVEAVSPVPEPFTDIVDEACIKPELEDWLYDPEVARIELEQLVKSIPRAPKRKRVKRKRPDPIGSSFSTSESLENLRQRLHISEDVEFVVPSSSDRADKPPPNHFTIYEGFFLLCFLWFPIPEAILKFLWMHNLAIAQINTRGIRHMVGILARSFECGVEIGAQHLSCLLEIRRRGPKDKLKYNVSNRRNRKVIFGFPSKDDFFEDYFFYVPISEASVGASCLHTVKTNWGTLGSRSTIHLVWWLGSPSCSLQCEICFLALR